MTDTERLSRALTALCWGSAGLAQAIGVRRDTVAKWLTGRSFIPPAVLAWIESLASVHSAFVAAHPPPKAAAPAPGAWQRADDRTSAG